MPAPNHVPIVGLAALQGAVRLEALLDPVAQALVDFSLGGGSAPAYVLDVPPHGDVHVKSAARRGARVFTVKVATSFSGGKRNGEASGGGLILVGDAATGDIVALLHDEHYLSDLRTAAAGALAARMLAPGHVECAGVLGAGQQAWWQLQALALVRPFGRIACWSRSADRLARFVRRVEAAFPEVSVTPLEAPRPVVEAADVLIAATASTVPLVDGRWLRPGQHITAVGADDERKCELDARCFARADRLVVDSRVLNREFGDLARALRAGELPAGRVQVELGDVLGGRAPGRQSAGEVTIAKLVGLGVQDLAAAEVALSALGLAPDAVR
jgi:ornithine cyclodeaminase